MSVIIFETFYHAINTQDEYIQLSRLIDLLTWAPSSSSSSRQKCTHTWVLILRAWLSDHDIVYIECITSLRRCQPKPRKIFKYSKANWENINKDLGKLDKYSDSDVNTIWNLLKNEIHRSVTENITQKMLKHRKNLPWITNEIKTKMTKYKKK